MKPKKPKLTKRQRIEWIRRRIIQAHNAVSTERARLAEQQQSLHLSQQYVHKLNAQLALLMETPEQRRTRLANEYVARVNRAAYHASFMGEDGDSDL